jgi:hypothetical protein
VLVLADLARVLGVDVCSFFIDTGEPQQTELASAKADRLYEMV